MQTRRLRGFFTKSVHMGKFTSRFQRRNINKGNSSRPVGQLGQPDSYPHWSQRFFLIFLLSAKRRTRVAKRRTRDAKWSSFFFLAASRLVFSALRGSLIERKIKRRETSREEKHQEKPLGPGYHCYHCYNWEQG